MFCLVTYILTQLISYEFILCCTCYDKLSIKKYKVISNELVHIYDDFDKADNISIELAKNGVAVRRLAMESKDLESFYLDMVGGSANV